MQDSHHRSAIQWRTSAYALWSIIGLAVIAWGAAKVLGSVASALAPFVIALLIVFLLRGAVAAMQSRGIPRPAAVALCYFAIITVIAVSLVFLVPPVITQLTDFAGEIPDYLRATQRFILEARDRFTELVPQWLVDTALTFAQSIARVFSDLGQVIAKALLAAGSGIATIVFDLFIAMVIAFWILKDLPKMRSEIRVLAGNRYEDDFENLFATVGRVVGGYLRGQSIASVATGIVAGIALSVAGIPYALVLAILSLVLNFVPYIGPFIAGSVAAAVGLTISPGHAVLAIALVILSQQSVDLLITPRVMSKSVDLHPTLVIFSLLVGSSLLGFWGLIFAIPIAATAKGLFVYYWERRNNRLLATEDGAFFRSSPDDEECPETADEPADCDAISSSQGSE